jgi:hypothetical protein
MVGHEPMLAALDIFNKKGQHTGALSDNFSTPATACVWTVLAARSLVGTMSAEPSWNAGSIAWSSMQ